MIKIKLSGAGKSHAWVTWSDKRIRGCKYPLFLFVEGNKGFGVGCLVIPRFLFVEALFTLQLYNGGAVVQLRKVKISLCYKVIYNLFSLPAEVSKIV